MYLPYRFKNTNAENVGMLINIQMTSDKINH